MPKGSEPRLLGMVFTHQLVIANREHDPEQPHSSGTHVEFEVDKSATDPRIVTVEVTVSSDEESSENPPYEYDVRAFTMVGYPDSDEESPLEEADVKRAGVIGYRAAIGSIREHIASMTSRAPWSVFFVGITDINEDDLRKADES